MKNFDTEYLSNKKANLEEIKAIIENIFTEDSEEWLSLYEKSNKNYGYLDIHPYYSGNKDEVVLNYLNSMSENNIEKIEENKIYVLEYRKYDSKNSFRHYRAFFTDSNKVYSYFEKYMNDEEVNTENWIDATEEFNI